MVRSDWTRMWKQVKLRNLCDKGGWLVICLFLKEENRNRNQGCVLTNTSSDLVHIKCIIPSVDLLLTAVVVLSLTLTIHTLVFYLCVEQWF